MSPRGEILIIALAVICVLAEVVSIFQLRRIITKRRRSR